MHFCFNKYSLSLRWYETNFNEANVIDDDNVDSNNNYSEVRVHLTAAASRRWQINQAMH